MQCTGYAIDMATNRSMELERLWADDTVDTRVRSHAVTVAMLAACPAAVYVALFMASRLYQMLGKGSERKRRKAT